MNGEQMCECCFRGKPIADVEESLVLPIVIADSLNRKKGQAQPHVIDMLQGQMLRKFRALLRAS